VLKEHDLLTLQFSRLSQLCIKMVFMFDLDQTFSLNSLLYKQTFYRLAIANKACASGEKQPQLEKSRVISFSGDTQRALYGLTLSDVWSNTVCPLNHPTVCATKTTLDENV